ncbi:MAG: TRAP transporter small permease [Neisseriaceae bacterium]|nr:TRAP transporter small permease [Neisseriaceae bacterium]
MGLIKRVDQLNRGVEYTLALMLAIMAVVVLIQVLVRFVFEQFSVPWSEEVAKYLMIWLTFLGGAVAVRKGKLIAIDSMVLLLPERAGKALKWVAHLLSLVFYALLVWIGWEWFVFGLSETAPVMKISKAYVYAAMFLGSALMVINTMAYLWEVVVLKTDIRGFDTEDIEL